MKQKIAKAICSFCILMLTFAPAAVSFAEETANNSITIVKYKLSDAIKLVKPLPIDGTKAEQITDVNGKTLEPFGGVQYEVIRVTPKSTGSGFEEVKGLEAFKTIIITDATGTASVAALPKGMYQISEFAHASLKDVMVPIVLELPLPQRNGQSLEHVYIYPKSDIVTTHVPPPKTVTRIPQTSGSLGTYYGLFALLGLLLFMGTWGILLISNKQRTL